MKTIYTLALVLLLTACAGDLIEARRVTSAFINSCKRGTITTNYINEGMHKTLTITCTKDVY
jgi:hypothetical protein